MKRVPPNKKLEQASSISVQAGAPDEILKSWVASSTGVGGESIGEAAGVEESPASYGRSTSKSG